LPKKTKAQVSDTVNKHIVFRWRILLRNAAFQDDLQILYLKYRDKRSTINSRENLRSSIADKWGLLSIPSDVITRWPGLPLETDDYPALEQCFNFLPYPDYSPVLTTEFVENRFLSFRVDVIHPIQDLLPLIEGMLREAMQDKPKGRRRFDKLDEQLEVFDLVRQGLPFKHIARKLKRREPTVKSKFMTACEKINGVTASRKQVEHKQLMTGFDPKSHTKNCPVCRAAVDFEGMCDQARHYTKIDHVSQREISGGSKVKS